MNGTLALQNGRKMVCTNALTVSGTGTLGFGLNAPDSLDPASTSNSYLKVEGSCTIANGSTIAVTDSGGLAPGAYLLVSATSLSVSPATLVVDTSGVGEDGWSGTARVRRIANTLVLQMVAAGTVIAIY